MSKNVYTFDEFCNENKSFRYNKQFNNSLEVIFDKKPSDDVLKKLRDNGFKWSMMNKLWYKSKPTEEDKELAKELTK